VDGTPLPAVALDASGKATLPGSALSPGTHTVTAQYTGNPNYNPSTSTPASLSQTVNRGNTGIQASSSLNPSGFGRSVTLTATVSVTPPAMGTPGGAVTFTIDGNPTLVGLNPSGQAVLTTSTLTGGTHIIGVSYGGDSNFNGVSTTITQNVNP